MSWEHRDYFGPTDSVERRKPATWIFMILLGAGFAAQFLWQFVFFRGSVRAGAFVEYVFLIPSGVVENLRVWQVVTHFFVHVNLLSFAFDLLAIYFFGKFIEEYYGQKKFIALVAGGGLLTALTYVSFGYALFPGMPYFGPEGGILAILVMAAFTAPNMPVVFIFIPTRLKWVAVIYVLYNFYNTLTLLHPGALANLAGAAWGFVFFRYHERVARTLQRWDEQAERKSRRKEEEQVRRMEEDVDRILDKIAREGMGALSAAEKRALEEASKRKRVR